MRALSSPASSSWFSFRETIFLIAPRRAGAPSERHSRGHRKAPLPITRPLLSETQQTGEVVSLHLPPVALGRVLHVRVDDRRGAPAPDDPLRAERLDHPPGEGTSAQVERRVLGEVAK